MWCFIPDLEVEPFKDFYVYAHIRKSDGKLFYIGKGSKKRAWSTFDRNKYWENTVSKHGFEVVILVDGMSEADAYAYEMLCINLFKNMYCPMTNLTNGGSGRMGYTASDKTRRKMSESLKGKKPHQNCIEASRNARSRPFIIVSPDNKTIKGVNLSQFCRENKLSRECIRDVISGKQIAHRGWTQYKGEQ